MHTLYLISTDSRARLSHAVVVADINNVSTMKQAKCGFIPQSYCGWAIDAPQETLTCKKCQLAFDTENQL